MKNASRVTVAVFILALVMSMWPSSAHAWLRMRYEDAQVVERSELIVVGAIKDGSVVVVPHPREVHRGLSWETHATLLVGEVVKGECREKELPIVIRYGLDVGIDDLPMVRGSAEGPTTLPVPKKGMSIHDTADFGGGSPLVEDARKEHLWFLRHGGERAQPDDKAYGIVDPEDVQPLSLRQYLESYMAAEPEPAVRAALQKQPEISARAVRYLQHREVQRILKEKDPAVRVERLLPYYRSRAEWGYREEARDGIVSAGEVAGPYLMGIYQETSGERHEDIIRLWGEIRYRACVPELVELLKRQDQYWAAQDLRPGWWNADVESRQTQSRRDAYGLVYSSVYALGQISDPRARDAIELTRRRWAAIKFENAQIVEACDQALKAMGPAPAP